MGDRRRTGGTLAWAFTLAALVFVAGAAAVALREHPDRVVGALSLFALCAACVRHRPRLAAAPRAVAGAPRPAHRAPEPRPARGSPRSGAPAQPAIRRAVRAHPRRPRQLQGRERRPRPPGRRRGPARACEAVRGDRPLERHGGADRRRRVRRPLARHGRRRPGGGARRAGSGRRSGARSTSTAPRSRSTAASAGRSIPDDGDNGRRAARSGPTARCTRRSETRPTRRSCSGAVSTPGIVRDVESALERKELVVLYQPIIHLRSGAPRGAEALVRRRLPDQALMPPAEFVPHVERTPLARELTFLVVADALEAAEHWADRGHRRSASRSTSRTGFSTIPQFVDGLGGLLRHSTDPAAHADARGRPGRPGRRLRARRGGPRRADGARHQALARRRRPRRLVRLACACSRSTS